MSQTVSESARSFPDFETISLLESEAESSAYHRCQSVSSCHGDSLTRTFSARAKPFKEGRRSSKRSKSKHKKSRAPVPDHRTNVSTSKFIIERKAATLNNSEPMLYFFEYDCYGDYAKYFHGRSHLNWTALDPNIGPLALSISTTVVEHEQGGMYRVMIRSKHGDKRLFIPAGWATAGSKERGVPKPKQFVQFFALRCKASTNLQMFAGARYRFVKNPDFPAELLKYEKKLVKNQFKVGVMYIKGKQKTEAEILGNTEGSIGLREFMEFMGEKVKLKGWKDYNGGLDTRKNVDGRYAYYTRFDDKKEVMFHVSTLLPLRGDPDRGAEGDLTMSRKVHIGNDIVVIVYLDSNVPGFNPDLIASQFNHVFIVVQLVKSDRRKIYSVTVCRKRGVEATLPLIPEGTLYERNKELRELLLTKVVSSERAAYKSLSFRESLERARCQLLLQLHDMSARKKKMM